MTRSFDLVIIGAGPAGMSAAIEARRSGLSVLVVDEQRAPGGQIWRNVEAFLARDAEELLGSEYSAGASMVGEFRSCGAVFEPNTRVWQVEPVASVRSETRSTFVKVGDADASGLSTRWDVFMSVSQQAECVRAVSVLFATGAQERPMPFPGWTLPGVLTIGAAQILLKTSRQVPRQPVWIAGSGPLPLLYMTQLLRAGGQIAGWLDTTPKGGWLRALPHAGRATSGWRDILKGLGWSADLRRSNFQIVRHVSNLRAIGEDRLEGIEYRTSDRNSVSVDTELLLIHEGIVPSIHFSQAIGCKHIWDASQSCFMPQLNSWGESSVAGIFIAGDGANIGGAKAATSRGRLAAIGISISVGTLTDAAGRRLAEPIRRRLKKELSTRPMLDAIYRPRMELSAPSDETVVCRCEELTALAIREAARIGQPGPNQVKAYTRAGMGPCQGRQCGYTVANIIAAVQCKPVAEVGYFRVRPPLKPVSLGEMASLDNDNDRS